jgi:hypothetical protein
MKILKIRSFGFFAGNVGFGFSTDLMNGELNG